jgi:hypothetical protein
MCGSEPSKEMLKNKDSNKRKTTQQMLNRAGEKERRIKLYLLIN